MNDGMDRTQKLDKDFIPKKTIPLVCSWCNRIYRIEQWKFQENERTGVSHGICPDCLSSMHGDLAPGQAPQARAESAPAEPEAEEMVYVDEYGNLIDPEAIRNGEYYLVDEHGSPIGGEPMACLPHDAEEALDPSEDESFGGDLTPPEKGPGYA